MEFGEKLKKVREEKGMTQQTLAEQVFVTRQAVSRWERGERYPDLMTTKCLSNILGVSIDSLVSEDEMREYTQKQSHAFKQKEGKVATTMYTLVALISIISLLPILIIGILIGISNSVEQVIDVDFSVFLISGTSFIQHLCIAIFGGYCALASVRKQLDAKYVGIIGLLFFILEAMRKIWISFYPEIANPKIKFFPILSCIFLVQLAFIIWKYFFSQYGKFGNLIKLEGILYVAYSMFTLFYTLLNFALNDQWEYVSMFLGNNILDEMIKIVIVATLYIQISIIERKNKKDEKELEEKVA